ncbi:MAG TPA: ankyrin repeat domain-containing protein [Bryobacteraceae bacterium]|nr:ankyrin repeat domain-containing protein [Bryobacteraceae bacterium]
MDLFSAAEKGDTERVIALLAESRSSVNAHRADGWTALHLAAYYGHAATAEVLLANGADVHLRSANTMNNTPIHAAAAGGHIAAISVLLAHGSDVNAAQHGGWTALHAAAASGNTELMKLLLAHGGNPDLTSDDDRTSLSLAMEKNHSQIADLLKLKF